MLGRQFDNLVLLFIEVDDNRVRVRHRQAHVIGSGLAAGRRNHLRSRRIRVSSTTTRHILSQQEQVLKSNTPASLDGPASRSQQQRSTASK